MFEDFPVQYKRFTFQDNPVQFPRTSWDQASSAREVRQWWIAAWYPYIHHLVPTAALLHVRCTLGASSTGLSRNLFKFQDCPVQYKRFMFQDYPIQHNHIMFQDYPVQYKHVFQDNLVQYTHVKFQDCPVQYKRFIFQDYPVQHKYVMFQDYSVQHKDVMFQDYPVQHKYVMCRSIPYLVGSSEQRSWSTAVVDCCLVSSSSSSGSHCSSSPCPAPSIYRINPSTWWSRSASRDSRSRSYFKPLL